MQARKLNGQQRDIFKHPYTCGKNSEHILHATTNGWICFQCDYRQDWCHKADAI